VSAARSASPRGGHEDDAAERSQRARTLTVRAADDPQRKPPDLWQQQLSFGDPRSTTFPGIKDMGIPDYGYPGDGVPDNF
jgi:hypothetical protein